MAEHTSKFVVTTCTSGSGVSKDLIEEILTEGLSSKLGAAFTAWGDEALKVEHLSEDDDPRVTIIRTPPEHDEAVKVWLKEAIALPHVGPVTVNGEPFKVA